ncbi:MAG: AEC family transporter [Blautia faecis]
MQISLLLMEEIAKLFAIMLMGYVVVKAGLMKSSESKSISVVMVYLVIPCVIIDAFQVDYTADVKKKDCSWHVQQQFWYMFYF